MGLSFFVEHTNAAVEIKANKMTVQPTNRQRERERGLRVSLPPKKLNKKYKINTK